MCMCCVDFLEFSIMDGLRSLITVTTDGGSTIGGSPWILIGSNAAHGQDLIRSDISQ